jgi:hypothetical protein
MSCSVQSVLAGVPRIAVSVNGVEIPHDAITRETRYGLHIIRLNRRIPGRELPFALVRERIADYLVERARRLGAAQFIARLVARAAIAGVELPTPANLRVN